MRVHSLKNDGFSLIELMVVVLIFGVLVAITGPSVASYMRGSRLTGTASTLEADLHFTRSLANARRRTHQVRFAGSQYSIVQASPDSTLLTRVFPNGVACTVTDTATFYPWGLAEPVTMTVANGSNSRVLQLSSSGKVSRE